MRLSENEKECIRNLALQVFGLKTKVILFGSRAKDNTRGGDIDLLILPPSDIRDTEIFNKKIQFIVKVLEKIGEQKIDVIVRYPGDTRGIIQTAIEEGIRLC